MFKKSIALTAITASLFVSAASPVYANSVPEFGSCVNPQWSKTQENHGSNHGVVNVGTFSGVDSIYASGGNALQCLCTDTGEGYQTNWLKASDYSHEQIESLKAQGWIYVPEGQDWGLEKGPYLAKNASYTCTTCTPTPTPTSIPGPTPTPSVTTQVQGASANNTSSNAGGLASTGNALVIYTSLIAGAVALILGMVLKKFSK